MATVANAMPPLVAGDVLTRDEFLARWEALPELRRAELIGGVVYMPSPLSWEHGTIDNHVSTWVGVYSASTPGCEAGNNATWLMLQDAPQPDTSLRIREESGGQSRREGRFVRGAPEFAAEVCVSSAAYDLHQKLDLYRAAGVREYLTVLVHEREVRWHVLIAGSYQLLPVGPDGVIRSTVFPGLWLQVEALLGGDMQRVLATLAQGIASPEHTAFVDRLAGR